MGTKDIQTTAWDLLAESGSFTSGDLVCRTGLTRQALHRHLRRWVDEGVLVREGRGRATRYGPSEPSPVARVYPTHGLAEDRVWRDLHSGLAELGSERTPESDAILQYAVTELVNNAIEHSGAPSVTVRAVEVAGETVATIADAGCGALESLRSRLLLEDLPHALQELSKGKVTTLPDRHTGEGIFFTSKMVARFELAANGYLWIVDNTLPDQTVRQHAPVPGTEVRVHVPRDERTPPEEVFARYTHDFVFDTTRCVIHLFEHGVRFVSRSEAKRLVAGLDRFREVILDFRGVEAVGQGFVDEVFRVWATAHPEVRLRPVEMGPTVEFMVRRGLGETS